jgi:hypothetical protein
MFVDLDTVLFEVREELARQGAEVDVGAGRHARRGERLVSLAATGHEQRRPLVDDAAVLGVLHRREQRLLPEGLVAGLEATSFSPRTNVMCGVG